MLTIVEYGKDVYDFPALVVLGCFDAIHLGHRELLKKAKLQAKINGLDLGVMMFKDGKNGKLVYSFEERVAILEQFNVKFVLAVDYDDAFKAIAPLDFLHEVEDKINVKAYMSGKDFRFGAGAKGKSSTLKNYAEDDENGVWYMPIKDVVSGSDKISTTLVKALLEEGNVAKANELLGSEFSLVGEVVDGRISYPQWKHQIKCGVYSVKIVIDQVEYHGTATFGGAVVEVVLEGYSGDLSGRTLTISFVDLIGGAEQVSSAQELSEQPGVDLQSEEETVVADATETVEETVEEPVVCEPAVEQEPVAEEITVEEEPAIEEEPVAEELPAEEETATAEEPVVEETEIVDEPAIEEEAIAEELPVEELEPLPIENLDDYPDDIEIEDISEEELFGGFERQVEQEEPVAEEVSAEEEPTIDEQAVAEELPVEEEPAIDEEPVTEELPVEDEPAIEEEPVTEELPVEEEPAIEEETIAEELPVEEEPATEEEPVVEEPAVEEEPVIEETEIVDEPAIEEEPVTEELPVEEELAIDEEPVEDTPAEYEAEEGVTDDLEIDDEFSEEFAEEELSEEVAEEELTAVEEQLPEEEAITEEQSVEEPAEEIVYDEYSEGEDQQSESEDDNPADDEEGKID